MPSLGSAVLEWIRSGAGRASARLLPAAGLVAAFAASACDGARSAEPGQVTLVLAAYTAPKDAYERSIIPPFQRRWKQETGQDVRFETSYRGSEEQVCAILLGFPADVAALSHEGDLDKLQRLGLIEHDWKRGGTVVW